jgi:N-acyl-D-glutamate deacylase
VGCCPHQPSTAVLSTDSARSNGGAAALAFVVHAIDCRLYVWIVQVGSDGLPNDAVPHPRLYGTFPRVLGIYCREEQLMSLEAVVHKMSAIPAETFGMAAAGGGRGRLIEGAAADIVVFDPASVGLGGATWEHPTTLEKGVAFTIVNGVVVWAGTSAASGAHCFAGWASGGHATGARPGRILRRQQLASPMAQWRPAHTAAAAAL